MYLFFSTGEEAVVQPETHLWGWYALCRVCVILLWKFYGHGRSSMKPITENTLFYGDNLTILREHILTESVDLIYLDPPFNSTQQPSLRKMQPLVVLLMSNPIW